MLSIGQFSKICQVSIKTLRHYDKISLMEPCCTDEQTGYRYYSEAQLSTMLLIQRLKLYGFSLSEIKEILSCDDQRALFQKLTNQKEQLTQQMADTSLIIGELDKHLHNFERTGNIMEYQNSYQIIMKNTEDTALISSRQMMSVEDFGTYFGKIYEMIAKEHLTAGKTLTIYHDEKFDPDYSDMELAVTVQEADKANQILKGCLCAMTTHCGPYSSLSDAYGAITKWIDENGYAIDGAPYEIYTKNQFDQLPPAQWETEVYFPIRKKA